MAMTAGIESLGPVVLFVEDLARSKAFYCDALGLALRDEDDVSMMLGVGDEVLIVLSPEAAADLHMGRLTGPPGRAAASFQLNFFVEDVDATHAALTAKGVSFIIDPVDRAWGRRTAHFVDPDGFVWEISAPIS